MDISTEYCPHCGKKVLTYPEGRKWFCPECGFTLYNNTAVGVGAILYTDDGRVLFEVRGKEPRKGCLTLPGGFVDPDESAEEACVRECAEEAGLAVSEDALSYVATAPNIYPYKGITYHTCDMFYSCAFSELPSCAGLSADELSAHLTAQQSEVVSFVLVPVHSSADVDSLDIAFVSARKALKKWAASRMAQ